VIPLPIRDETPTERTPVVTIAIILANVAVWIWQVTRPPYPVGGTGVALPGVDGTTLDFGAIPYFILHGLNEGTVHLGRAALTLHQEVPQPWMTVFTSMFMHGSWLHIIGNMWFLWIFGDNIEDAMGSVRYVFFYLICGVAAAGAQILATPHSTAPMVGASGAIAGVLGGYILLFPRARIKCLWILIIIITTITLPA
jgi:membrane associated rhomboid family serine protease